MANKSQLVKYELEREVLKFMLNVSKRTKDIVNYFSHKWQKDKAFKWTDKTNPETKRKTINNYIKSVKETYFSYIDEEIIIEKGRALARLDDLYSKSVKIQDWRTAISIIKEIRDIVGFKAAEQIETKQQIEIKEIDYSKLSTDTLKRLKDELSDK